jgi:hypothetical protein
MANPCILKFEIKRYDGNRGLELSECQIGKIDGLFKVHWDETRVTAPGKRLVKKETVHI